MIQLRRIRQKRGVLLRGLGVRAEVHAVSLVRLESGKLNSRFSTRRKLAEALEVTVCELRDDQPIPRRPHGIDQKNRRVLRRVFRLP